jgi:ATP-dependent Lon protease
MTGELSLSGRILPVHGIREKILAAQRAGIRTVILPGRNAVDVGSMAPEITEGLEVVLAEEVRALVERVLLPPQKR